MGLALGTQAEGKRLGHEATCYLGFSFFFLICLFLLLLHDLQVVGVSWDVQERTLPGTTVTVFLSPYEKEFKRQTEAGVG